VSEHWYLGTADAVYQNLYSILRENPRYLIVLSGDHVYKMDYARMLRFHQDRGGGVTLSAIEVPLSEGRRFGIVEADEGDRVVRFDEKPANPSPMAKSPDMALASMGVYIFDTAALVTALEEDARSESNHDFGRDILPALIRGGGVYAYPFTDENKKASKYWRDIGTIDAYYEANMDLCHVNPEFNLYDPEWPLRTYQPQLPPAKFVFDEHGRRGVATESIVSTGCIVSGSEVRRSILSPGARVHSYCDVQDSILMTSCTVQRHSRVRRAILDRNVQIPRGAVIGYDLAEDRRRHTVSDSGVVVVTPGEQCYVDPAFA
jgi:glucose-1-phosphate adenylyltransferase